MEYKDNLIHFTAEEVGLSGLPSPYPAERVGEAQLVLGGRLAMAQHEATLSADAVNVMPINNEAQIEDMLAKRTRATRLGLMASELAKIGSTIRGMAAIEKYLRDQVE